MNVGDGVASLEDVDHRIINKMRRGRLGADVEVCFWGLGRQEFAKDSGSVVDVDMRCFVVPVEQVEAEEDDAALEDGADGIFAGGHGRDGTQGVAIS